MHSGISIWRRQPLRALAGLALCLVLAGCGFHLKGVAPLPFDTLYTNIPQNTEFGARMRRAVMASSPNTRFVAQPKEAQAKLIQLDDHQSLKELTIDANGQVEDYELVLVFVFEVTDAQNHLLLAPTTLRVVRDLPYDPSVVQAKQGEIASLFSEMRRTIVDRVVRHLTAPDVIKAYQNPDKLPIAEGLKDTAPLPANSTPETPTPWSGPNSAGTGLF
jgi:LPS-assembly lipoprotein